MSSREVPIQQAADAEILAAMQNLLPVRCGDLIHLLPRKRVMDLIEESRLEGRDEDTSLLLRTLEFDGEAVFRRSFTQMTSRAVQLRTSTLCRMLEVMARTGESRDDLMRRLLAPLVRETLDSMEGSMGEDKAGLLRLSLNDWTRKRTAAEEVEADELGGGEEGTVPPPVLRLRMDKDSVPEDLKKYSRYFLKNLFRLNNIHGRSEFSHPPEVIEDYWEVVSPEQGVFHLEIAPSRRSLTIGLYHTSRSFGLARTENPDYYDLVEFLVSERRDPRIKGCQVVVHGATAGDEVVLQEALSIESMMVEDPTASGMVASVPRPMSAEGLSAFRSRLMQLTGIRSEVRFPINVQDPECGERNYSVLGFDLRLDRDTDRFVLDDVMVTEAAAHAVGLVFADKLMALSRDLYRDPQHFPRPDIDQLDNEVHALIGRAEREELTEDLAREIVAKITVLDYYESLARYSYALAEQLVGQLEGMQKVTFTIPRALLALLDVSVREEDLDDRVLSALREGGAR
ncbi:MAG: hypothetical protein SA339_13030 [Methanomassiliicoccus sp.]|nr:hypothetical protein [Methanomassiliicoccus sp.]